MLSCHPIEPILVAFVKELGHPYVEDELACSTLVYLKGLTSLPGPLNISADLLSQLVRIIIQKPCWYVFVCYVSIKYVSIYVCMYMNLFLFSHIYC